LEDDIPFKLLLLAVLFFLSAFFSGSEASLFSLTNLHLYKIREDNLPTGRYIERLLSFPRRLLITILVGNEAVNITISVIITSVFIVLLGAQGKWAAMAAGSIGLLVIGEAVPKTIAVTYPIRFSSIVAVPLRFFSFLMYPIVRLLDGVSAVFVAVMRGDRAIRSASLTEDEFISLIEAGHREGTIEQSQRDLIHRVFDLADTTVAEIMTPRVDMFCLPLSMPPDEMRRKIIERRCSRVPIYQTDRDDIIGILNAKDLLFQETGDGEKIAITSLLKKPYFVPMVKPVDDMLKKFQIKRIQTAIVVDEYGGVAGIVTLHDIRERLLGSRTVAENSSAPLFREVDAETVIVSGMMSVEDFNATIGRNLISEECETVGGFVFHQFGKLPVIGDEITCKGYRFTVEKTSNTRILSIRATRDHEGNDD